MNLVTTIKECFDKGFFGRAMKIEGLPQECPAWSIKETEWIGIGLPMEKYVDFSESFSGVEISCERNVDISGNIYTLLLLKCTAIESKNQFATVCADFCDPGKDGKRRKLITEDPEKWWKEWKQLIGNVSVDKSSYDVLAELITLNKMFEYGYRPVWTGQSRNTNDLETSDFNVEVKSTIRRYGYEVTFSSIYQLYRKKDHPLYLSFLRFEASEEGISIDDILKKLISNGVDSDILEKSLKAAGLGRGKSARKNRYSVIEWKLYSVDENFPAVTEANFKDNRLPECVIRFVYTLDLSGISEKFNLLDYIDEKEK